MRKRPGGPPEEDDGDPEGAGERRRIRRLHRLSRADQENDPLAATAGKTTPGEKGRGGAAQTCHYDPQGSFPLRHGDPGQGGAEGTRRCCCRGEERGGDRCPWTHRSGGGQEIQREAGREARRDRQAGIDRGRDTGRIDPRGHAKPCCDGDLKGGAELHRELRRTDVEITIKTTR